MKRRNFLGTSLVALGAGIGLGSTAARANPFAKGSYPVEMSDAAWKQKLGPKAFRILRKAGTETPYSSPLNKEKRAGTFHCAGCNAPLFSSRTKFDSGTGWPSFWAPLDGRVEFARDASLLMTRTEEHCARCGGHLGHVFDDGPKPTGKRHCINGLSLKFRAG